MFRIKCNSVSWNFIRHKSSIINIISDDYQYFQKSILPMLHFQKSLPRLPIPKLDRTCDRYLTALQPILNTDQFNQSQQIINEFRSTSGPELDNLLRNYDNDNKEISYITMPWSDMYLSDRKPLPINYTPFMVFQSHSQSESMDQLIRATNMIVSSMRFMRSLRSHYLSPEVYHLNPKKSDTSLYKTITKYSPPSMATYVSYAFKAFPLDMSQYQGLFGATRIPQINKDVIFRDDNTRHLLVMRKGHLFKMDVLDVHGNIEAPEVIMARLKYILNKDLQTEEHPLGVMTTDNRDSWAKTRKHLIEIGNTDILHTIDSALFCLCLDDTIYDTNNLTPLIRDALCSTGINRWFDKSFSLIIAKDGTATVNFEHSWGDGVAVLRYFNDIFKATKNSPFIHADSKPSDHADVEKTVQKLEIQLDDQCKMAIKNAYEKHTNITNSLAINYFKYDGLNKKLCKEYRLSPDSIMQLAFQMAFFEQNQKFVPTYESCSTAAFRHGRTETIRPCTNETKLFCTEIYKIINNKLDTQQLRGLIDECSKRHSALTKEAAMGQGFDRHLFALKNMAKINGHDIPAIYTDPSYEYINHNILSTSTLSSPALLAGGFGPVVHDGFGIGYSIQDDYVGCVITNYKNQRNGTELLNCVDNAFKKIKLIAETSMPKK